MFPNRQTLQPYKPILSYRYNRRHGWSLVASLWRHTSRELFKWRHVSHDKTSDYRHRLIATRRLIIRGELLINGVILGRQYITKPSYIVFLYLSTNNMSYVKIYCYSKYSKTLSKQRHIFGHEWEWFNKLNYSLHSVPKLEQTYHFIVCNCAAPCDLNPSKISHYMLD